MIDLDWLEVDDLGRPTIMLMLFKSVYFYVKDQMTSYGLWQKLYNLCGKPSVTSQVYWLKGLWSLG